MLGYIIYSDGLRDYGGIINIDGFEYSHLIVNNHTQNLVDPELGTHIQTIGLKWRGLKSVIPINGSYIEYLKPFVKSVMRKKFSNGIWGVFSEAYRLPHMNEKGKLANYFFKSNLTNHAKK